MNDWQNWIVAGIVTGAAGYVLRAAWLVCMSRSNAHGSCHRCIAPTPPKQQVVTLQINLEHQRQPPWRTKGR